MNDARVKLVVHLTRDELAAIEHDRREFGDDGPIDDDGFLQDFLAQFVNDAVEEIHTRFKTWAMDHPDEAEALRAKWNARS